MRTSTRRVHKAMFCSDVLFVQFSPYFSNQIALWHLQSNPRPKSERCVRNICHFPTKPPNRLFLHSSRTNKDGVTLVRSTKFLIHSFNFLSSHVLRSGLQKQKGRVPVGRSSALERGAPERAIRVRSPLAPLALCG